MYFFDKKSANCSVVKSGVLVHGTDEVNLCSVSEPNEWGAVAEIQDWKSMAEALGCVHQLLSVLLQDTRGDVF